MSRLPQQYRHSQNVVGPFAQRFVWQIGQIKLELFREFRRTQNQLLVGSRRHSRPIRELNCAWQDEAVVIVEMLADKVHATWGNEHAGRHVEFLAEPLSQFVGVHSAIGIVM
jgi:hypothetical protein